MTGVVDLDAYFGRIQWGGDVRPTYDTLAPPVPVPLRDCAQERLGPASHWMARDGDHWVLQTRTPDKDTDCWISTLEPDNVVDFEVGNHYTSTYPTSPFVNRILLRALTADGRVAVMNRDVTVRRGDTSQSMQLADRAALRALLVEHFGFDLPEVEQIRVPTIPEWN